MAPSASALSRWVSSSTQVAAVDVVGPAAGRAASDPRSGLLPGLGRLDRSPRHMPGPAGPATGQGAVVEPLQTACSLIPSSAAVSPTLSTSCSPAIPSRASYSTVGSTSSR